MKSIEDAKYLFRLSCRGVGKALQFVIKRSIFPCNVTQYNAAHNGVKVFANCIPKSGTHLLKSVLGQVPGLVPSWFYHINDLEKSNNQERLLSVKRGQAIFGHMGWNGNLSERLDAIQCRKILMIRDIRDVDVSGSFYLAKNAPGNPLYHYFCNVLKTDHDRLLAYINGVDKMHYSLHVKPETHQVDPYNRYLPWLDDPNCLVVRFEELVGSKGGGSDNLQFITIRKIVNHVLPDKLVSDAEINRICLTAFNSKSRTFRSGRIGGWRRHFTDEHVEAFKRTRGDILVRLGYEDSNNW